ncbi:hypothetical protein PYW07_007670 [Mythimna separata]|uniref:Intraflagellar transport protein 46 homolog n=1 Tax=Mythimna separata TaxID=271217 RepID=A0AAD7YPI3_MYTSE|nr:hypothetical protein PYW07_007670 [Mythimna separata]
MAHQPEPMDIDSDFDNKENSLHHNNVLPFTEKGYEELDVSELNMKLRYTPQKIDIDLKLQPFVPEYVPAVGDIDAFIKVSTPACNVRAAPLADNVLEHIDNLAVGDIDAFIKVSTPACNVRAAPLADNVLEHIDNLAVGDIDAFIKVSTPACNVRAAPLADNVLEHIDNLGLTVLDEPAAEQSDSALLHLQLRAISKTSSAKSTVLTKKIENPEKNSKAVERWIKDVSELHLSKPAPTVAYTSKMPDIDNLMEEWPESMEETLNDVGFPPGNLDCSLSQYVDLVCGLFDVPIAGDSLNDRIQALHLLFSLYSAVKTSQLYAERQKERSDSNA